jgi:hypothetical protein
LFKEVDADSRAARLRLSGYTGPLARYMLINIGHMSAKEKAIVFRLFALIKPLSNTSPAAESKAEVGENELIDEVLYQLERDFLQTIMLARTSKTHEKPLLDPSIDLVDLINYMAGLVFYRPSGSWHAHSLSTEIM